VEYSTLVGRWVVFLFVVLGSLFGLGISGKWGGVGGGFLGYVFSFLFFLSFFGIVWCIRVVGN